MSRPIDLETAFVAVVEAESSRWRAYVATIVGPRDADEVTQDALLRAYRALGRFRGDGPLEAWLLRIVRSAAIDHVRRSRRRPATTPVEAGHDVASVVRAEVGVELHMLIDDLSDEVREAFVLTQVVGCSYGEAADIVGVPIGTIRSRVFRARRDLLSELAPDAPGPVADADRRTA